MKSAFFFIIILFALVIISCDSSDSVVGNEDDTKILYLSFTITSTKLEASSGRLVAKGTVKNNGNSEVTSPWYVEAQFFTDSTLTAKLGGSNTQIGVPISKGQSTFWTIYFTSENVDVTKYPNFAVSELRGIYK